MRLGGKNHFAADRETAEAVLVSQPGGRLMARENRAFLGRAVRYLVAEAGVREFLDIGTGRGGQVDDVGRGRGEAGERPGVIAGESANSHPEFR
jgi:hypothetical protein